MALGEIARTLQRLDNGQKEVLSRLELMRSEFVHRDAYEVRTTALDREMREVKERMSKAEQAAESRRPSWPAVTAAVGAIVAAVIALVPRLVA